MSTQKSKSILHKKKTVKHTAPDAKDVVNYLKKNPDFFNSNPELLAELSIPHQHGGAVSLVERQVAVLREQNQKAKKRLHELIEIARRNEKLARHMHQLSLSLMAAKGLENIFSVLYNALKKNFLADQGIVRLFADPVSDTESGDEFVGADCPEKHLFQSITDKRLPISGHLNPQQCAFLFDDKIESAVIVPLHGKEWDGLLAIGSLDEGRFQPVMGVDLLSNLGDILSLALTPWIQAD